MVLSDNKPESQFNLKESTSRYFGKATKFKEKTQTMRNSISEQLSDVKVHSKKYLDSAKVLTEEQLNNVKNEAQDMKRIFQSKDLIYLKTEACAIVLRKLGRTDEFLSTFDKLTKEGYRLVHQEIIRNIPVGGGASFPLGSFYFFQHVNYITK